MELKEIKKLISYAKRNGLKSIKIGEFEATFHEAVIFPSRQKKAATHSPLPEQKSKDIPAPAPLPTLDEINEYIYGKTEEAH